MKRFMKLNKHGRKLELLLPLQYIIHSIFNGTIQLAQLAQLE